MGMEKNYTPLFDSTTFDPIEFLNKHCLLKDEYQLNSLLADLNKEITTTNNSSKTLVKENFSKFLICKNIIDKLRHEKSIEKIQIKEIRKNAENIQKTFLKIITDAQINLEEEERNRERERITRKYQYLFNGQTVL